MVYFQCELCIQTLKKKQVERHYSAECRQSHKFSCLTCYQIFDRATIVSHTSCISEEEKYQKGDLMAKKANNLKFKQENLVDNSKEVDFSKVKWSGVRKTAKNLLKLVNIKKLPIEKLVYELSASYARYKQADIEAVDSGRLRSILLEKVEENSKFQLNLNKNTIKLN